MTCCAAFSINDQQECRIVSVFCLLTSLANFPPVRLVTVSHLAPNRLHDRARLTRSRGGRKEANEIAISSLNDSIARVVVAVVAVVVVVEIGIEYFGGRTFK